MISAAAMLASTQPTVQHPARYERTGEITAIARTMRGCSRARGDEAGRIFHFQVPRTSESPICVTHVRAPDVYEQCLHLNFYLS